MAHQFRIVSLAEGIDKSVTKLVPDNLQQLIRWTVFGHPEQCTGGTEQGIDVKRTAGAANMGAKAAVVKKRTEQKVITGLPRTEVGLGQTDEVSFGNAFVKFIF